MITSLGHAKEVIHPAAQRERETSSSSASSSSDGTTSHAPHLKVPQEPCLDLSVSHCDRWIACVCPSALLLYSNTDSPVLVGAYIRQKRHAKFGAMVACEWSPDCSHLFVRCADSLAMSVFKISFDTDPRRLGATPELFVRHPVLATVPAHPLDRACVGYELLSLLSDSENRGASALDGRGSVKGGARESSLASPSIPALPLILELASVLNLPAVPGCMAATRQSLVIGCARQAAIFYLQYSNYKGLSDIIYLGPFLPKSVLLGERKKEKGGCADDRLVGPACSPSPPLSSSLSVRLLDCAESSYRRSLKERTDLQTDR
uniref:Uncharacterized protein n=1 Tax=Chromera velia CCMP2878 TaxID=1169474 RepID=A0A0G4FGD7_9ALVE|eukprot:Cvel_16831.t1-p1 / transcript=Cvel_16831.t1 / gene=Cvel_16831 / organism=Chromera_velia_CCMP2878 / gene_product=hypothetical protein / transcript_product=hypothetical protein / location=Cvel_scaffold1315:20095-21048(-) / protein_length=318 / sequence_SO=supercontig / SO=protein_coding / is_pseudo=false